MKNLKLIANQITELIELDQDVHKRCQAPHADAPQSPAQRERAVLKNYSPCHRRSE